MYYLIHVTNKCSIADTCSLKKNIRILSYTVRDKHWQKVGVKMNVNMRKVIQYLVIGLLFIEPNFHNFLYSNWFCIVRRIIHILIARIVPPNCFLINIAIVFLVCKLEMRSSMKNTFGV